MTYRYLTFDCYGTLIDWRAGIAKGLKDVVGDIGLDGQELLTAYVEAEKSQESSYKKYREVLGSTVKSMSSKLGTTISDSAAQKFASSIPNWPAYRDTSAFLKEMGRRGYRRYILSNVDDDLLEATISNHELEIEGFVTAEQVRSYKPNHGHWVEFMRRTGSDKGQILHVAQSVFHDIIPARELGIDAAWVNRYREPIPNAIKPQYVTGSLSELGEMLKTAQS